MFEFDFDDVFDKIKEGGKNFGNFFKGHMGGIVDFFKKKEDNPGDQTLSNSLTPG